MKVAVCFVTLSAECEAHRIARLMQTNQPDDEVCIYNRPTAGVYPMPPAVEEWGATYCVYVTNQRREYRYG